jgi:hypothetical protein
MRRLRLRTVLLVAFIVTALLAVAFRHVIVRGIVAGALGIATRSWVTLGDATLAGDHIDLRGVRVQSGGEPELTADRIFVAYSLRDLFPGGARRLGLRRIEIDRPHVFLSRRADGTFSISRFFVSGSQPSTPETPQNVGPPYDFTASVTDGSVTLLDPYRVAPESRRIALDRISLAATVRSDAVTSYDATGAYAGETGSQPFSARGLIDVTRRYAMHRIRAERPRGGRAGARRSRVCLRNRRRIVSSLGDGCDSGRRDERRRRERDVS